MARPACWRSTSGPLYLLVVAKGRTENDFMRLRVVAISSGKARRRKSISLSEPAFWNGSTAIAVWAAGPLAAGTCCRKRHQNRPTSKSATAAAAKTHRFHGKAEEEAA